MSLWSEEEFKQAAISTRLSDRTLEACKDVLVNGLAGVAVAEKHKMLPAQISRGLKGLRDSHAELLEIAKLRRESVELLKSSVVKEIHTLVGKKISIMDAEPGQSYEGPCMINLHGYVVQKVGKQGIIHDVGKLSKIPDLNVRVSIEYPNDGKLALVRGKDVDRYLGALRRSSDKDKGGNER